MNRRPLQPAGADSRKMPNAPTGKSPRPSCRCAILCLKRALDSTMDSMNGPHGYPRPLCLAKLRGHAEKAEPGGYRASLAESPLVSPLHARSRAPTGGARTHRAVDQRRRTGVPAQVHQRRNQCPFQLDHVRDGGRCRPTEVCVPTERSADTSQLHPTRGPRRPPARGRSLRCNLCPLFSSPTRFTSTNHAQS